MKILDRATLPNGTDIQLEDWSDKNTAEYPDLYGLTIGAYPIAVYSNRAFTRAGERFRLDISHNSTAGYTNEQVRADYEALKSGKIELKDLRAHFWYGENDAYMLGLKGAEYNV